MSTCPEEKGSLPNRCCRMSSFRLPPPAYSVTMHSHELVQIDRPRAVRVSLVHHRAQLLLTHLNLCGGEH